MSDQAPIVAVASEFPGNVSAALADARIFPVIDADWRSASNAIKRVNPAAVVVAVRPDQENNLRALADELAPLRPYVPLIVVDPTCELPMNALPFGNASDRPDRIAARLRNAMRVRTLDATVLRRSPGDPVQHNALRTPDPIEDVTVLLLGRGGIYPTLSVAFGERVGLVGALSIENAAKQLNARDVDGIVIADGFSDRVVDAFLTVLSEDARYRNLPIVVTSDRLCPVYELPNLEIITAEPSLIPGLTLPLFRQQALSARLSRALTSLDNDGLIDVRTGLLTGTAFARDFATAVYQTQQRGGGLSIARFTFDEIPQRAVYDAARIASRLMRQMDFGTVTEDNALVVVFAEAELRNAHMIARRLSSVMKHTMQHGDRARRADPRVALTSLLPRDTSETIMQRLRDNSERRVAS